VLLGSRSIGAVKVNVPSSIHDLSVDETFLAIFKLESEDTRTFLPLTVMLPDLRSL